MACTTCCVTEEAELSAIAHDTEAVSIVSHVPEPIKEVVQAVQAAAHKVEEVIYLASADPPVEAAKVNQPNAKPGKPCRSRTPVIGDLVVCSVKKYGNDIYGEPKKWVLLPGHTAKVIEVDDDQDFRLLNSDGMESGFLFRSEFHYVMVPEPEAPPEAKAKAATKAKVAAENRVLIVDERNTAEKATSPTPAPTATSTPTPPAASVPTPRRISTHRHINESGPSFDVVVSKDLDNDKVGLHLDTIDDTAFEVLTVLDGIVKKYNATVPPEKQVLPGCFLVSINGIKNNKYEMVKELSTQMNFTLRVAPRHTFSALVEKPQDVGLSLIYHEDWKTLFIQNIDSGAVEVYNESAPADKKLQAGDRIEEVNGVTGSAEKMLEELKASSTLKLKVARPSL